jgi:tRNA-dihydrouridine synthase A
MNTPTNSSKTPLDADAPTFSVAPMMDWTDRHCRYLHRLLSKNALLFTEMITAQAILHGDQKHLLEFDPAEQPVVLQLGGSEPTALAKAVKIAESYGYVEFNLNCGCPSDRVQSGSFGACLMREPQLVADCIKAMRDATSLPVTVKHRIGLERDESYAFVRDFVGAQIDADCSAFSVHARNAWLDGLSPKENRTVPPLRYEVVYRLKREFPRASFFLNGGLRTLEQCADELHELDGVMLGRTAYETPWLLTQVDTRYRPSMHRHAPANGQSIERAAVIDAMKSYAQRCITNGSALRHITRHMLGLCNGLPGARSFRRTLSDATALRENDPGLIARAFDEVQRAANRQV